MSNKEFNRLPDILPKDIAANSSEFVTFLKKYYEFVNQDGLPSYILNNAVLERDVSNSVGNYLSSLYRELGYGYSLDTEANRQNIIQHLPEIYAAKGSVDSIKVLFRVLFGEEVEVSFPKELILIPSSGNWLSEYSVMVELVEGDPFSIVGKFVEVETNFPNTPSQSFEVEIKRVERKTDTIYEVFTSRYFSGFFYWGSKITYLDLEMTLVPSMSEILEIEDGGSGFRVGESFVVNDYQRQTSFNDTVGIPSTYTRNVPSQSKFRNYDVQSVDIDVRTDGTITEVINYESDSFGSVERTNVIRGTKQVVRLKYQDGTEETFTETIDGVVAPNLEVNWDAIASAMVELSEFEAPAESLTFYSFLQSENPVTLAAYADVNEDGRVSVGDAISMLKGIVGLPVDAQILDNIQAIEDDWFAASGETISLSMSTVINVLRISVGIEDPDASALTQLIDWIQETEAGQDYARADIDNDGVIDTDDMIAILKYLDETGLRTELPQIEINWIEGQLLNPFNALNGAGQMFEGLTDDDLVLAFGLVYSAGKRNILHDFLLEVDGDYNTGHVRADINNDGVIDTDDVQILLRRSAGISIDSEYLTWIDEVIVEPLIGSEYNPVLIDGAGAGAVCRVKEVDGSGAITKLAFQSFGYNYPDNFATFVAPSLSGGTTAKIIFGNKIVGVTNPSYVDRKGFLSDIIKVQDNDFYQQFSYVIETGVEFEAFSDILSKSVNPAGMKFFANQTITDEFSIEVEAIEDTGFYYNRLAYDIAYFTEATTNHFYKVRDDEATAESGKETYAMSKARTDEAEISEQEVYNMQKDRADLAGVTSSKETYSMQKPREDQAEVTSSKETYSMQKLREDQAEVSEQESTHIRKPKSDFYTVSEQEVYNMEKVRADLAKVASSKETYSMQKLREDQAEVSEIETFEMAKSRADEAEVSEQESTHIRKPKSDFYTVSENEAINLSKIRADSVEEYSDEHQLYFTKGPEDLSTALDAKVSFDISKSFVDSAIPSDVTDLTDKDIYSLKKVISEAPISVSDLIGIGLSLPLSGEDGELVSEYDESIINFGKVPTDLAEFGDQLQPFVIGKSLYDTATGSELLTSSMQKPLQDVYSSSDEQAINLGKVVSETSTAGDSLDPFVITKEKVDLVSYADDEQAINLGKALSETPTAGDSLDPFVITKEKVDLVSYADIDIYSFIKILSDSAGVSDDTTTFDDDIYSINKVITNFASGADSTDLLITKPYVEDGYFEGRYYSDYAADIETRSV